jgi:hypothetical protein
MSGSTFETGKVFLEVLGGLAPDADVSVFGELLRWTLADFLVSGMFVLGASEAVYCIRVDSITWKVDLIRGTIGAQRAGPWLL